ncbi:MAG TPA: protein kinase [Terrimicrobiaceae bacterium]
MQAPQSAPIRTMVARVSLDDIVIYANGALAEYLGASKRNLIGSSLDDVALLCSGEVSSCFARPETGRTSNRLVMDGDGRVFEAQLYSDGGILDIVLDDVASPDALGSELRKSSGAPLESLSEEELRTVRHPERRYLTVTYTQLHGLGQLASRLAPMEVKLMVDSFVEEACEAVRQTGCTVGETARDAVLGIYGAPRYYADHPLRAILSACDQIQKTSQLHAGLYREGKELPPCSCGVWTGDTLVGILGTSIWQRYTAVGASVDLASKLCRLARPGETVLPEHTLTHMLRTLPEGWQHIRAESQHAPDLSDVDWTREEITPVPEHLSKVVYLVGRGVQENADRTELYFDYLWSLRVHGRDQPTPILRVVRPALVGDSFELSEDNVVTNQATQALGRYKLIEVIGTGGMGTVWRGVDRFGNALAIKILHTSQTVTEAQLKRFRREAEIMARLPHRNICRVYEMNEFDGIQYLAMEFVDGLPLSDLLYEGVLNEPEDTTAREIDLRALIHSLRSRRSGQNEVAEGAEPPPRAKKTRILPIEQTLSLVIKVCDAIQFAHEHGVLHRDLKPGNILLREDGEPLVADFGLAKLKSSEASHSLSVTGHVVGTLENMAPEQAESSKDVDERADVYSIGTILYQMLTGRRHFEATGNIVKDAQALKTHEPVRPRALNPQIHPDLEIITLKALRTVPAERYRSVAALRADIDHYRRGEVISAKPVSPLDLVKKLVLRNKLVSAVSATSILVIVCGALISIYFLNLRLKEANEQYLLVERALQVAGQKEQEAMKTAELARVEQARAEDALAEMQRAVSTSKEEHEDKKQETAEIQVASKSPEEDERLADQTGEAPKEQSETIETVIETSPPPSKAEAAVPTDAISGTEQAGRQAMIEANRIFNSDLSQGELRRLDKAPDEVVHRLVRAMDSVSRALTEQLDLGAAWMLKGRLHMALMEFDAAIESFRQAVKIGVTSASNESDSAAETLELLVDIARAGPDKLAKAAQALQASSLPQNQATGSILQFLNGRPALRKASSNAPRPLRREMTGNEVALTLIERNGADTRVFVRTSSDGRVDLTVWGSANVGDLRPLRDLDLSGLAVIGARALDWQTILSLPIESLDFAKCPIESFPQPQRGFLRVRSLKLAGSEVASVEFARSMPLLETLDLSSTHVTDLSPLVACRSLRRLDLAGLNPVNPRTLTKLPIESLTVSPMLITDRQGLNSLRFHRTLRVLRSPDDSPDQTASEFWRKLDSGAYNQVR